MSAHRDADLAIIGLSCRLPEAHEAEEFGEPNGNGTVATAGELDYFDAEFFGYSTADVRARQPAQYILLELIYTALESAAYDRARTHARVGVYVGMNPGFAAQHSLSEWIASALQLTGPAICVASERLAFLTALRVAGASLSRGEAEIAVVGSAWACGSAPAAHVAGGGAVVLRRLVNAVSDGDPIHAVIDPAAIQGVSPVRLQTERVDQEHVGTAAEVAGLLEAIRLLKHQGISPPAPETPTVSGNGCSRSASYSICGLRDQVDEGRTRAKVLLSVTEEAQGQLVLEQAPEPPPRSGAESPQLLILSACTAPALERATQRLRNFLERSANLSLRDAAFTLQTGRQAFRHRRALVCADQKDAVTVMAERGSKRMLANQTGEQRRPIVFLFPGVGDQYVGMAHELYEKRGVFRHDIDLCAQILQPYLGSDIRGILYPPSQSWKTRSQSKGIDLKRMLGRVTDEPEDPDTTTLNSTALVQPALFTIEYAMARLWQSLGVVPDAIVGHSMGEYVAACLAGVFSLEEALRLVATRARLVNQLPQGAMLSVMLPEEQLRQLLPDDLYISLVNGPSLCVVAGVEATVSEFEKLLNTRDVISRRVQNGHAFHSKMLEPIVEPFMTEVNKIRLHEPRIRYVSNVTGNWITAREAIDPNYWAMHAVQTARFSDALHQMWQLPDPVLLECGAGRTLSVLAAQHPDRKAVRPQGSIWSIRQRYENESDESVLLGAIGKLWLAGVDIDWERLHSGGPLRRVAMPTYPFERIHYWNDSASGGSAPVAEAAAPDPYVAPRTDLEISLARACERVLGIQRVGIHDNFFELGGHSLAAIKLIIEMKQTSGLDLNLGEVFRAPTIAELVRSLSADAKTNASIVVPLQPRGDRVPVFCVCGIDIYGEFAQSLGQDQPVYGVYVAEEQAMIDEVLKGEMSGAWIERLADAYFEAIIRYRPRGPYCLAGISFGGVVAMALASRMRQRGDQVELVFLFDTMLPEGRKRMWSRRVRRKLAKLATLLRQRKIAEIYAELRRRIVARSSEAAPSGQHESFNQEFVRRQRASFVEAAKHWQGKRMQVDFPVVLFRAIHQDMWGADYRLTEDYGWRRYTGDWLSIVRVDGGHISIIQAPNVAGLSREARRYLDRESSQAPE